MRLSRRLLLKQGALAAVALAFPSACRDGPGGRADGAPQVLRVNLGAEPATLDPQRAADSVSITVLRSTYSTFLRLDEELRLRPDLAREVPSVENGGISEDGLAYTFRLREGLKWSDGAPLLAQGFVDGARRLFEPGSASYYVDFYRVLAADSHNDQVQAFLAEMDPDDAADQAELARRERAVVEHLEVSAPDERTVVYRLSRRSPVFLLLASLWPLYPVRQELIDQHGDRWTEAATNVSNGPFALAEWQHDQHIALRRNRHYHADAPALERIDMDMADDRAIAFLAYQADELDAVSLGPTELVQVRDGPLAEQFRSYAALQTLGVYFNLADPMLADVRVRQALAGGFDREQYAEIVREGAVLPAYSWLPPGMPGWDADAGEQYRDALDRSRSLLEEAGHAGGDGVAVEILASQDSVSALTTQWLKEQWERNLGITVAIRSAETSSYYAERSRGNFQVAEGGWGADYPDPQNWLPLFQTGGLLNAGNFSDVEFDRLVEAAGEELDNERRLERYQEAQRRMLEQMPFAPLYHGRHNVLVKPWVRDLVTSPMEGNVPGDLFFDRVSIEARE